MYLNLTKAAFCFCSHYHFSCPARAYSIQSGWFPWILELLKCAQWELCPLFSFKRHTERVGLIQKKLFLYVNLLICCTSWINVGKINLTFKKQAYLITFGWTPPVIPCSSRRVHPSTVCLRQKKWKLIHEIMCLRAWDRKKPPMSIPEASFCEEVQWNVYQVVLVKWVGVFPRCFLR